MSDQTIKAIILIGGCGAVCLGLLVLIAWLIYSEIKEEKGQ